jgi:hypothetical protein
MLWLLNLWNRSRCRAAARSVIKRSRARNAQMSAQIRDLENELFRCKEQLETEQVKCRVLEIEVELLAGVHARDVQRWQQEHPVGSTS